MQSEVQCAETTVDDHLRNLIQLMKRGGRVSVTDIPNDPTFLSSHFGGPTVQAMAEKLEAALFTAEPVPTKLRMIVSHATMGQTDGEGLSTNDICVKITALRNELFKRAQSTSPSVAVKADLLRKIANTPISPESRRFTDTKAQNEVIGYERADWMINEVLSALSAQVQDVEGLDEKAEAYAVSISETDRYEVDVKEAFIAGYKYAFPAAPANQEGGTNE